MSANFNESSGEIVSEDSYCGFRSLKDPTSLIIVPTINNNIDEKSQVSEEYDKNSHFECLNLSSIPEFPDRFQ